ncbi:MAG TPA: hypothetical protein VEW93_03465 [Acidimicrobiales bacterium]|nr:hypothetical protein [Acidimicrobiales bacterium]
MKEVIQILLALGPLPLLWILSRQSGVLWRLMELPGLVRGRQMRWAMRDIPHRCDRIMLGALITLGYLCSTVTEAVDAVDERLRPLLLDPATASQGRAETFGFLRTRVVRPPAVALWALLVSVLGWLAGSLMSWTHANGAAMGHLTTPYVMALVTISMARVGDNKRPTIDNESGSLGAFMVAVRIVSLGSLLALLLGHGWSEGSLAATALGTAGLVAATVGGAAPIRRWLRAGTYEGWRQLWLGRWIMGGAVLCAAATMCELMTHQSDITGLFISSSLLGATAFIGAAGVFALLGKNPPGPSELDLVKHGAGPDDGGTSG